EHHGFSVVCAVSPSHAVNEAAAHEFPIIVFEFQPQDNSALFHHGATVDDAPLSAPLAILHELRRASPASQVVLLASDPLPLAVCCQAVRCGAAGFVEWRDGQGVDRVVERLAQALGRYETVAEEGRL